MKLRSKPARRQDARAWKVWPASEAEPRWMIRTHRSDSQSPGAPGIFGNGLAELYFDNIKVYANK
jgi:hypothetical protein